ncbi:protein-export chaperone SecB [Plasticicumulans acidivorans]|uniref:Protein-export protein SecB n=1 Tax=Plasticicumulans acidivorans TaxID=886464 RepID=A0A317MZ51_9GAMM|nr:protein-export chaperone SecB [Plasticicumulans acidivorans]PWV64834.1 protein translocase subunit secB [Plasticicumulans acidivorans]
MTEQANVPQQHFDIQKIYLKDLSFETPHSPMIFTEQWSGESQLQLNNESTQLAENIHEVVLTLTVTTKNGDKTAYLCEVKQAGIFTIAGFAPEQLAAMLGAYCPNVLFPFGREMVSSLVQKGGFPPLILAPVNFDALYMQHLQAQQAKAAAQPEA